MKRSVTKIVLSLVLIFALTIFSACTHSNDDFSPMIGSISGIKASYKPEAYPVTDYYDAFAEQIMVSLADVFGNSVFPVNDENKIDWIDSEYQEFYGQMDPSDPNYITYEDFELDMRIMFLDDIRNSIYLVDGVLNTYNSHIGYKWNWTIGDTNDYQATYSYNLAKTFFGGYQTNDYTPALTFAQVDPEPSNEIEVERNNFYSIYYAQKYAPCLQTAILQILLGKTPTEFSYNFTTNEITPNPATLLDGDSGLKVEYSQKTTYIGISQSDIIDITNYILDKTIGNQKFSSVSSENPFSRNNYENIIEQVIWQNTMAEFYFSNETIENDPTLGSIYDIYPAILLKDYATNSFFISSISGDEFAHIPSGEYQSIILMPNEIDYLSELWFYLVSENALTIKYHYRYYDAETDMYYISNTSTTTTNVENEFVEEESPYVGVLFKDDSNKEILYKTQPFNNMIGDSCLSALTSEKIVDYQTSQYFKTIESSNGFGSVAVLNEQKFREDNSSYFEIVFDVEKDPDAIDTDYSFKVGMYALWFASQTMIDDFLFEQANS